MVRLNRRYKNLGQESEERGMTPAVQVAPLRLFQNLLRPTGRKGGISALAPA